MGLIANPAAAHDIRRLSGLGSIVDNQEKARILRRVLLGLQATGVTQALAAPDHYGLAASAASVSGLHVHVRLVDMECARDETDSTRAAQYMADAGCACIVTLGGDGTNRAVAKGCGDVPLLAISTGTNNVIPERIEGVIAGMAAGLFTRGLIPQDLAVRNSKRLEVTRATAVIETALVDIAASTTPFLGARAVTDTTSLTQLWLTQAVPGTIGLAAIGANVSPLSPRDDGALLLDLAGQDPPQDCATVIAPIAPGQIERVGVRSWRRIAMGESVALAAFPRVLALDGERSLRVGADDASIAIRATWNGPRMLDTQAILDYAARHGLFVIGGDPGAIEG
ncbi:MAG TPA: NAD(+)/NADH kinase [Ktedonobacterales bacterium]